MCILPFPSPLLEPSINHRPPSIERISLPHRNAEGGIKGFSAGMAAMRIALLVLVLLDGGKGFHLPHAPTCGKVRSRVPSSSMFDSSQWSRTGKVVVESGMMARLARAAEDKAAEASRISKQRDEALARAAATRNDLQRTLSELGAERHALGQTQAELEAEREMRSRTVVEAEAAVSATRQELEAKAAEVAKIAAARDAATAALSEAQAKSSERLAMVRSAAAAAARAARRGRDVTTARAASAVAQAAARAESLEQDLNEVRAELDEG